MKCITISIGVCLALVTGCSADNENESLGSKTVNPGSPDEATIQLISGTYAEKVVLTTIDSMPMMGDSENVATYYSINTIKVQEGQLVAHTASCRSVVKNSVPVETIVPDRLTQCIEPMVGEITVSRDQDRLIVKRAEAVMPVGVRLENPWDDPLPTDAEDPRIWDQDGDGKPGLTATVKAASMEAEIYVIRRERGSWVATFEGGDPATLKGLVQDSSEQVVIGASDPLFKVDIKSRLHPDPAQSTIELVKIKNDYTCERLLAELEQLFPEL